MKKLLVALLLVLSFTFVSCGNETTTDIVALEQRISDLEENYYSKAEVDAFLDQLEIDINDVNNNTYYNYEFIEDLVSRIDELENELKELTP